MPPRRSGLLIVALSVAAVAYFACLSALAFADANRERGSHEAAVVTVFWLAAAALIVAAWFFGVSLRWWAWIPVALWLPALVLVVAGYDTATSPTATPAPAPPTVSTQRQETQPAATTTPTTTASPPQETLPSPPPEPSVLPPCTEDGIHFAGKGPQDARVCFTLTDDRSAWLEIHWSFIPRGDCGVWPERTWILGPPAVPLDAPGHIDVLVDDATFTAFIDGAQATGYLTDPDTCGSKRLEWHARRVPR